MLVLTSHADATSIFGLEGIMANKVLNWAQQHKQLVLSNDGHKTTILKDLRFFVCLAFICGMDIQHKTFLG